MSVRAILIGLALVIIQTAITPYNDYYLQGTDIAGNHFPLGTVFTLIFLTLAVNPILKKVSPRAVLNPSELMIIWVMMVISSAIPSKGNGRVLTSVFWRHRSISLHLKMSGQKRFILISLNG